jgi:hypothetical protein
MQRGYAYRLTAPMGKDFHSDFRPELAPKQMLALGIFGGRYMTDCAAEYPKDWFDDAKLCPDEHDPELNCVGSTRPNRCRFGESAAGFTKRILAVGFNGIAGISWVAAVPMMRVKSGVGARFADISHNCSGIVSAST